MFDIPRNFEPTLHYFKRDSYISVICQASVLEEEGRKADADTHLAVARSQNTGNGIPGTIPKMRQSLARLPFYVTGALPDSYPGASRHRMKGTWKKQRH